MGRQREYLCSELVRGDFANSVNPGISHPPVGILENPPTGGYRWMKRFLAPQPYAEGMEMKDIKL